LSSNGGGNLLGWRQAEVTDLAGKYSFSTALAMYRIRLMYSIVSERSAVAVFDRSHKLTAHDAYLHSKHHTSYRDSAETKYAVTDYFVGNYK